MPSNQDVEFPLLVLPRKAIKEHCRRVGQDTCKHVGVGLLREQGVKQADVAVLQHAAVVVHASVLMPRVDQEAVVLACPPKAHSRMQPHCVKARMVQQVSVV